MPTVSTRKDAQPPTPARIPPSIEVESQPVSSESAGAAAEKALALYRTIFQKSIEAIAILDPKGFYLAQNASHERLIGYSDSELRERTPAIHLGEKEFERISAELRTSGASRSESVSRTKSGDILTVELSSFAVRDGDGAPICFVGIKRDVTEQRRAAAELRQKFDELRAIHRMVETVARAGAPEDIYSAALDELLQTLRADRASVLLFDPDGVMRFKAWRGLSEEYRQAVEGHSPWNADDKDAQPILVSDVQSDLELAPYLPVFRREGIGALGFIPLIDGGQLLGKFMVYFDAPHLFTPTEVRLASTIASHISFAITRQRAETSIRRSEERYRLLAEAGSIFNSSLDFKETIGSITRLAVSTIADWCVVDLFDEKGDVERIAVAAADEVDDVIAHELHRTFLPTPLAPRGIVQVARSGQSELVEAVDDSVLSSYARDSDHLELLRSMRLNSFMSVPLVTRGRSIGVLSFAVGATSGRNYSTDDLSLAVELARLTAVAIDNARLYREAQEASLAKTRFLATMSHELRTPLNAIGGYTELLQLGLRGPLTELQKGDLTRIQRSQTHLISLINDLLDLTRIEAGHLELQLENVPVHHVLEGLESLVDPQIVARGITFVSEPGEEGIFCKADSERLRQVLLNLLSNAVKFTPRGGDVSLRWTVADALVHFHVRDSGPGIASDKLETIFEPFVQLANTLTRASEGTGLGLSISRDLARAMGGDVTVISSPGAGSTFTCTVPVAIAVA